MAKEKKHRLFLSHWTRIDSRRRGSLAAAYVLLFFCHLRESRLCFAFIIVFSIAISYARAQLFLSHWISERTRGQHCTVHLLMKSENAGKKNEKSFQQWVSIRAPQWTLKIYIQYSIRNETDLLLRIITNNWKFWCLFQSVSTWARELLSELDQSMLACWLSIVQK